MTTTIDMTPTWVGILPALLAAAANGNAAANSELLRMAQLADDQVATRAVFSGMETSAGEGEDGMAEWQVVGAGGGDMILSFPSWIDSGTQERIAKTIAGEPTS